MANLAVVATDSRRRRFCWGDGNRANYGVSQPELSFVKADHAMQWSLVSAVNNREVLTKNLLRSPDIGTASEVMLQTDFPSAATAYNAAIERATSDILVFAHQDVYLPQGWISSVEEAGRRLATQDPSWGVLGVWGGTTEGRLPGYMYWTGVEGVAGRPFEGALDVNTLDEVVLILRKSSGLRFDEQLPGYHMYGTDICMEANRRGMKCYSIPAFCIHNTNDYRLFPLAFWRSYFFIRRKWKSKLPIASPCIEVTNWCWPMIRWNLIRMANILMGRHKVATRTCDPSQIYSDLVNAGLVASCSPEP